MASPALSPFTRTVVDCVRGLYPEKYADKSFDNTGLLLESPANPSQPRQRNSALLTVDLTTAVADEAIRRRDSVVIAYHPIIFRPLKSLTLNDTQQTTLLRLAQAGISVYSPHTAIDAAPGGMGDWLCDVVTGCYTSLPEPTQTQTQTQTHTNTQGQGYHYTQPTYPQPQSLASRPAGGKSAAQIEHVRRTIHPAPAEMQHNQDQNQGQGQGQGLESEPGMGRLITFGSAQPLGRLVEHIAAGTGVPGGIPIAVPQRRGGGTATTTTTTTTTTTIDDVQVRTVGVCPGSGAGVLLKGVEPIPDLLLTGEMGHHETLAAIERGSVVVSLFHSNTERGFLHAVMRGVLGERVRGAWREYTDATDGDDGGGGEAVVDVSEADRDPYGVLIRRV